MANSNNPSAAAIIIGNELLNGKTKDLNVHYLASRLHELGVDLKEVRFIIDDEQTIINVVNTLRTEYTYVFTTGGIGPTHDDITAASVAKAFGRKLVRNQEAYDRMQKAYPQSTLTKARVLMADMPENVTLIDNPVSVAPGFQIENVFVLAGIPSIMQAMFECLVHRLELGSPLKTVVVYGAIVEGYIAQELHQIQNNYPQIEIGSYPRWGIDQERGVEIVMKGQDASTTLQVAREVEAMFKSHDAHYERMRSIAE